MVSKSKKLYVLFDVVPAKSVTGGPWYSDQEFDHEFVAALSDFIVNTVNTAGMMDQAAIAEKIRTSGVSNVSFACWTKMNSVDMNTSIVCTFCT